jgi:protein-disulfide isomerase
MDTSEPPSQGPADAAVVVDVFSDFECPYCSLARRHVARLLEDFPSVRVRYRHFPLPSHIHAGTAAEASVEAYAQGGQDGFWCFHEQVFENQSALSRALLLELATRCDLDPVTMRQALEDHRHAETVRRDRDAGQVLGVEGTPSFVVNGTLVAGGAYTDLEEAVELVHPSP